MNQCNYYRKTSIDKFNNRPPFDIKKMDDATSTENKEQNPSLCNKCEMRYVNTAAKSYLNVVKYLEHFSDKYQNCAKNKKKNIIPKIIESFQRVTPITSQKVKCRKKSESLETIFRNKSSTFGKTLPNHRLMKDLLKNFDGENAGTEEYQLMDMIPSKDISIYPPEVQSTSEKYLTVRIDKKTSTTGLQWPILLNEQVNFQENLEHSKNCKTINNSTKLKSKIPQRKDYKTELNQNDCHKSINLNLLNVINDGKTSSGSSDLEYFPTKENPFKKADLVSKIPKHTYQIVNNANKILIDKEFPKYKYNAKYDGFRKENTYVVHATKPRNSNGQMEIRLKEKSFVQLQVEKFNKKNNNKNIHHRGRCSNRNTKTKDFENNKKNMNLHYISLMTSVRETLPKIEGKSAGDSVSENHDWSDNHINPDTEVRFPKETRNAMEHLLKNVKRVPLTKYTRNQNFHIQPAISMNCHTEYKECNKSGKCHKKVSHFPCSKNLLCQRGNHDGPCTKPETAISARYDDNRLLLPNAKGFVK